MSRTLASRGFPSDAWMKAGTPPRGPGSVRGLTAPLALRNRAHGNGDGQGPVAGESGAHAVSLASGPREARRRRGRPGRRGWDAARSRRGSSSHGPGLRWRGCCGKPRRGCPCDTAFRTGRAGRSRCRAGRSCGWAGQRPCTGTGPRGRTPLRTGHRRIGRRNGWTRATGDVP